MVHRGRADSLSPGGAVASVGRDPRLIATRAVRRVRSEVGRCCYSNASAVPHEGRRRRRREREADGEGKAERKERFYLLNLPLVPTSYGPINPDPTPPYHYYTTSATISSTTTITKRKGRVRGRLPSWRVRGRLCPWEGPSERLLVRQPAPWRHVVRFHPGRR